MKKHLLFVCSSNIVRSPTAEDLFKNSSAYEARSAGILDNSPTKISQALIDWADMIFVFSEKEGKHLSYLRSHFNVIDRKIVDLDISNNYPMRGDPKLSKIIKLKLAEHLK